VSPAVPVARYRVRGGDDPELVPRVFGQFARRGLVPAFALVRRHGGQIGIQIEAECGDTHAAEILAETLRALIQVEDVALAIELPG
jgi:hypothetical protein